jgi:hypothetical protein
MLHRTPDTFPSFLNDVCQSVLEFVANTNYERIRYRGNGYKYSLPVTSPNGSMDPFTISVEKHYGSSDHVTYMQHGIPSVIFVTWPDMWYHSSNDTPDKLDPTQFKRAAVVGMGALSVLASAGDETATAIAGESIARGSERMGDTERKGLSYLSDANDPAGLSQAYKEARNAVRHQAEVEKGVIHSVNVLFNSPSEGQKKLVAFEKLVDERAASLQNEVTAYYRLRAEQKKAPVAKLELTTAEKDASRITGERVVRQGAGPGGGGGGFGGQAALANLTDQERASLRKVPQHMTAELNILLGQKKSVLEIRDFLSGEFDPLPLQDLLENLRVQEKMGNVKLSAR